MRRDEEEGEEKGEKEEEERLSNCKDEGERRTGEKMKRGRSCKRRREEGKR